jgi:hypothetical protein
MKIKVPGASDDSPSWMKQEYEVHYCDIDVVAANILDCPAFAGSFDTAPYIERDRHGRRRWSNFMSGSCAWDHCVSIISSCTLDVL